MGTTGGGELGRAGTEVDVEVMAQVKVLYVRNLMLFTSERTIEDDLVQHEEFSGLAKVPSIDANTLIQTIELRMNLSQKTAVGSVTVAQAV